MPERHLHFNILTLIWLYLAIVVVSNAFKFAMQRWPIPGLTELVQNT